MKKICLVAMCIFALSSFTLAKAQHPNFVFNESELREIRKNTTFPEWRKDLYDILIKDANLMMDIQTQPYVINDTKNRVSKGIAGRGLGVRIGTLSFAGYVTEKQKYFDKAKEILLAVVRQTEAHDTDDWRTHLQVGDAAQSIAIGYDLLYNQMNKKERAEVYAEIEELGDYLLKNPGAWGGSGTDVTSCNHNSVHHGALGLCALITGNEEWLNKAIERVDGYYKYCADDTGYVTESHHYLSYGLGGAFPFSLALKRVKGIDLISKYKDLFSKFGDQITWNLLPNDRMVTLNDTDIKPSGALSIIGAVMYNKPEQLWSWLQSIETKKKGQKYISAPYGITYARYYLFMPLAKYVTPVAPTVETTPLTKVYDSGRVFMRSGWGSINDAHVSFTSGWDHHHGHNHQDENSLTFYALGDTFIEDPSYWPMMSFCHSTLKINGEEQWITRHTGSMTIGKVETVREDENGVFVRGEAKGAYTPEKGIATSNRKLYFMKEKSNAPYVIWRDDASMVDGSKVEFISRIITRREAKISDKGKNIIITGENGAKALVLSYSGAKQVNLNEDDIKDEFFERRNVEVHSAEYFKRLSAEVDGVSNPRFSTIVLPYNDDFALPKVSVAESGETIKYTLDYPNGKTHIISLTPNNITTEIK